MKQFTLNWMICAIGFLWLQLASGDTTATDAGYCGVADDEDKDCFNMYACDDLKITVTSLDDSSTCGSNSWAACTEERDGTDHVHGECVVSSKASTEVLGSDAVKEFCGIFKGKDDCLSKTGLWCAWEQHCEHNEDLCSIEKECEKSGVCSFDGSVGTCQPSAGQNYMWWWVVAGVMVAVTALAMAIPFILGKILGSKVFEIVTIYLSTMSGATLFSLAIIHLLSEGVLYENMTSWSLCHTWTTFTVTFVITLISFAFIRYTLSGDNFVDLSYVSLITKYTGIIVHCVQEGLVVGLQAESVLMIISIVIIIHKILFAISLGTDLKKNWSIFHLCLAIIFVISSPVAVIGAAYGSTGVDNELFAHFNAFSAAAILVYSFEQFLDLRNCYLFKVSIPEPVVSEEKLLTSSSSDSSSSQEDEVIVDASLIEKRLALKDGSSSLLEDLKKARSTFLKRSVIAMTFHYIIMFAVSVGIFFLMAWHLTAHDHTGGDHDHEGHDHEGHEH